MRLSPQRRLRGGTGTGVVIRASGGCWPPVRPGGTGSAATGSAGTGSAGTGSAGTSSVLQSSVGTGSVGTGSVGTGSVGRQARLALGGAGRAGPILAWTGRGGVLPRSTAGGPDYLQTPFRRGSTGGTRAAPQLIIRAAPASETVSPAGCRLDSAAWDAPCVQIPEPAAWNSALARVLAACRNVAGGPGCPHERSGAGPICGMSARRGTRGAPGNRPRVGAWLAEGGLRWCIRASQPGTADRRARARAWPHALAAADRRRAH